MFTRIRQWSCGAVVPRSVVAVPARNEAGHVGRCLAALAAQTSDVAVVLLLNNCTDGSFEVARAASEQSGMAVRIFEVTMAPEASHAGGARRAAMELAADWLEEGGVAGGLILTTDADSCPTPDWTAANQAAIARGVDAVAGRIDLDPNDARALPEALHARGRLEATYETLLTEMFCHLDPCPHDPWPRHGAEPGASLAVTLEAYRAVGGLPSLPLGEDRALVAALEDAGFRVRHDPAVSVVTSGRTTGRANGGVADTIRLRCERPDSPCDPYLEPARNAYFRGLWRGKLRKLHANGFFLEEAERWMHELELLPTSVGEISRVAPFGAMWRVLECLSPRLGRRLLVPCNLPLEIRRAHRLLRRLRQKAAAGLKMPGSIALPLDTVTDAPFVPLEA